MGQEEDGPAPLEPAQPDGSELERLTPTLIREVTQLPDARRLTFYSRADPSPDKP